MNGKPLIPLWSGWPLTKALQGRATTCGPFFRSNRRTRVAAVSGQAAALKEIAMRDMQLDHSAERLGKIVSAVFIAALLAMFGYGYLVPLLAN